MKKNARLIDHFNTIYRQFCLISPTLYSRAANSYLSLHRRKEGTTSSESLLFFWASQRIHRPAATDREDWSGLKEAKVLTCV